ncbi:MAG: HupV protein [Gammaproteobacteria bacterium]|nr:MAG: HupV protein [Gammaproteobacteria bacterium]
MSSKRIIGPIGRVEGDLEVTLTVEGGQVARAEVNAPLYRGFERILQGRPAEDALVVAPRICGICSVSQSVAAARALASLAGITPPPNGQLAINLVHAAENLADHLTHFYVFFMPDFCDAFYSNADWHDETVRRYAAHRGEHIRHALKIRARLLHIMGQLAGKWPHSLAIRPGGITTPVTTSVQHALRYILRDVREFMETRLFGARLEAIVEATDWVSLNAAMAQHLHPLPDAAWFLRLAEACELEALGRGPDAWLSYGAYPGADGNLFAGGTWQSGYHPLSLAAITEDTAFSKMQGDTPLPPERGKTHPELNKPDAYSWCKAPRYRNQVMETGALARQVVHGTQLAHELVRRAGGNVLSRVVMRLWEMARLALAMESWVNTLEPNAPGLLNTALPSQGSGIGLTEAARGSLGHWLSVSNEQICLYQIVAPTTWNFSPRDHLGQAGALEQALEGLVLPDKDHNRIRLQHIIRSFDPCMACTVH